MSEQNVLNIVQALRNGGALSEQLSLEEFRTLCATLTPADRRMLGDVCAVLNEDTAHVSFVGSAQCIITVSATRFLQADDFCIANWSKPLVDGTTDGKYAYRNFIAEEIHEFWRQALILGAVISLLAYVLRGNDSILELAKSILNATAVLFAVLVVFVGSAPNATRSIALQYRTAQVNKFVTTNAVISIAFTILSIATLQSSSALRAELPEVSAHWFWGGVGCLYASLVFLADCLWATLTYYFDKARSECIGRTCISRLVELRREAEERSRHRLQ